MRESRRRRPGQQFGAVMAGLLLLAGCTSHVVAHATTASSSAPKTPDPSTLSATPAAIPVPTPNEFPSVGPLFRSGQKTHFCTASVIASTTGNTLITAAHCVPGDPAGMMFAPGYSRGVAPDGYWRVIGAYVSPLWQHQHSVGADDAVLTVAARRIDGHFVTIAHTTTGELVGNAPAVGTVVTVVGYNAGVDDAPIACSSQVYIHRGYPSFHCHGYVGGTSGSPWLTTDVATGRSVVRGVIGGLHLGGCHEYTSHTAAFSADVRRLVERAEAGGPPNTTVVPDTSSGC